MRSLPCHGARRSPPSKYRSRPWPSGVDHTPWCRRAGAVCLSSRAASGVRCTAAGIRPCFPPGPQYIHGHERHQQLSCHTIITTTITIFISISISISILMSMPTSTSTSASTSASAPAPAPAPHLHLHLHLHLFMHIFPHRHQHHHHHHKQPACTAMAHTAGRTPGLLQRVQGSDKATSACLTCWTTSAFDFDD